MHFPIWGQSSWPDTFPDNTVLCISLNRNQVALVHHLKHWLPCKENMQTNILSQSMVTHIVDTACIVCRTGCMKRVTVGPSVCSTIWPQLQHVVPSVLWRCWLDGRKGIRPVKNRVVVCWCGCLSGARCRLADPSHCHSLSLASVKSRFWYRLTWVVPEKGPLNGCVCVCAACCRGLCWRHRLTVTATRCPAAVAPQHGAAARCSVANASSVVLTADKLSTDCSIWNIPFTDTFVAAWSSICSWHCFQAFRHPAAFQWPRRCNLKSEILVMRFYTNY